MIITFYKINICLKILFRLHKYRMSCISFMQLGKNAIVFITQLNVIV